MANEEVKVEKTEVEAAPDVDALKAEIERLTAANEKLKNAQSNASADAAKSKKEAREKMDEHARAEAETKELIETLKAENERMKREQDVAVRTAAYIGVGFDEATAKQAAESFGGNFEDSILALKNFITAHDKEMGANALRATPRPGVGGVDQTVTKEQFEKMTYPERLKIYEDQPELYQTLTK